MCNVLKNEGDNQEKWPTKQEEHERKTHNNQLEGGRQNMIKVQTGWDSREKIMIVGKCIVCFVENRYTNNMANKCTRDRG